jgi:hypothetical protein
MTTTPDSLTMARLALIRLLYIQGAEQSRLPSPRAYSGILTLHDAVELFLGLVADRLGANLPDHLAFMRYWDELHPNKLGVRGVDLSGRGGMDRLNRLRNGFKHAGTLPGVPAVEQARAEVTTFFEDNTLKVFGISFDQIDMADVVPQQNARTKLKEAAARNSSGARIEAMALVVDAFKEVFDARVRPSPFRGSPFSFGQNISYPLRRSQIETIFRQVDPNGLLHGRNLAEQIHLVMESTRAIQVGMRVIALGIDYVQYLRFQAITPSVFRTADDTRHVVHAPTYAPRDEDFDWCRQFVITVALRLAEVEVNDQDIPPSSRAAGFEP